MSCVDVRNSAFLDLVDENAELEEIVSGCMFTEGPVWTNAGGGSLLFSDIPGDARRSWSAAAGVSIVASPSNKSNGMAYDAAGRLLICEHSTSTLLRVEADGSRTVLASHWEGKELNSPNDVIVGKDGSIYFTDPPYGRWQAFGLEREQELDFCGVYRVSPSGELSLVVKDFIKPNGLCFSLDESILYINDTDRGHIRRFSVNADGSLSGGEVIYQQEGFGLELGIPDGMKLDANGNLWTSGPGGVHVTTGDGELLGLIKTAENVGNHTWGGADWSTLFICTSTTVQQLRTKVAGNRTPGMR